MYFHSDVSARRNPRNSGAHAHGSNTQVSTYPTADRTLQSPGAHNLLRLRSLWAAHGSAQCPPPASGTEPIPAARSGCASLPPYTGGNRRYSARFRPGPISAGRPLLPPDPLCTGILPGDPFHNSRHGSHAHTAVAHDSWSPETAGIPPLGLRQKE